jgi:Rrf2 family transcriptional regulator, nitric oxide-sensitive transcriptional repressor
MRLTKHSDYALRVLVYVASAEGRQVSTDEVSEAFGISTHHLVKVVGKLGKTGFLTIKRGRLGGFQLARAAMDIRIGEVVQATEPDFALVACLESGNTTCVLTGACGLVRPLREAQQAFIAALDKYTLADAIGSRGPRYRRLLGLTQIQTPAKRESA